jgi:hypothetical protein
MVLEDGNSIEQHFFGFHLGLEGYEISSLEVLSLNILFSLNMC